LRYSIDDETTEFEGSIRLDSITGLSVMTNLPGANRPGLLIKTKTKDYSFAASSHEEEALSIKELELWVPAILAVKEGEPFSVPKDQEVLLEFSMNSEEEVEAVAAEPKQSTVEIEEKKIRDEEALLEQERKEIEVCLYRTERIFF
jgi:hypothetical protein